MICFDEVWKLSVVVDSVDDTAIKDILPLSVAGADVADVNCVGVAAVVVVSWPEEEETGVAEVEV